MHRKKSVLKVNLEYTENFGARSALCGTAGDGRLPVSFPHARGASRPEPAGRAVIASPFRDTDSQRTSGSGNKRYTAKCKMSACYNTDSPQAPKP